MDAISQRTQRAIESLLENESLTADLDDQAANTLLDWGSTLARQAAQSTSRLEDEHAEVVLSDKMRAVRLIMRYAGKWAADPEQGTALEKVFAQAAEIYGESFLSPSAEQVEALQLTTGETEQASKRITLLRQLIEPTP